jgi:hypothetical protein
MYPCSLVRIPEQITHFALHSFKWFLFHGREGKCLLRGTKCAYHTNYVQSLKGWPAVVHNKKNTGFWDRQVNCAPPRSKFWTRWQNFANFDTQIRPIFAPEFPTGWQTPGTCIDLTQFRRIGVVYQYIIVAVLYTYHTIIIYENFQLWCRSSRRRRYSVPHCLRMHTAHRNAFEKLFLHLKCLRRLWRPCYDKVVRVHWCLRVCINMSTV